MTTPTTTKAGKVMSFFLLGKPSSTATKGGPATAPTRKRRHIFRWVFLAVQLIFLAWAVSGAASGAHNTSSAQTAGTTLAVMVIIFLWAAVDVILGVGWLIFRRRG